MFATTTDVMDLIRLAAWLAGPERTAAARHDVVDVAGRFLDCFVKLELSPGPPGLHPNRVFQRFLELRTSYRDVVEAAAAGVVPGPLGELATVAAIQMENLTLALADQLFPQFLNPVVLAR